MNCDNEVTQWEQKETDRGIIRFWGKYCVSPYEATSTKGSGYAVHYYGMTLHMGSLKECMDFCEGESSNET